MSVDAAPHRPGPPGAPLVGVLFELRRDLLAFVQRLARDYGDIAYFRIGPARCVLINRPEWIERLFARDTSLLRKSWDTGDRSFALGKGLLTSEGELWRRQRRMIQPAFHPERIRRYASVMAERAEALVSGWGDGEELDIHDQMSRLTLEILARTLFGTEVEADADAIGEALEVIMAQYAASLRGWLPIPMTWPTPGNLRARRAVGRIDEVVYRMLEARRGRAERGDDLLSWLIGARDEEGELSDAQLRDELVTLLLVGHETTALALSWSIMLLAQHPEADEKLAAELRRVTEDGAPVAPDASGLEYTGHVVEEAMRLYPPVWGNGREAKAAIDLDGYQIPEGTMVVFSQWATHRDPRFFPEPERFDPERWSPARRSESPRHAYFPFGWGPRSCIGAHFAMIEARLVLAAVMRRFQVELVPGHPIELQPTATLRPRHGIRAVVKRRGSQRAARPATARLRSPGLNA